MTVLKVIKLLINVERIKIVSLHTLNLAALQTVAIQYWNKNTNVMPSVFDHIQSKEVVFELTGQPKLNGSRIGVLKEPPPMILNEFVPSTGVMALPKIQSPGDTTTW